MKRSHGTRQGTRSILSRSKSQKGRINISRIMHSYTIGDRVSIVIDGAQQKGMPHRRFQGATGVITAFQGRAYVVDVKDKNMLKTPRRSARTRMRKRIRKTPKRLFEDSGRKTERRGANT